MLNAIIQSLKSFAVIPLPIVEDAFVVVRPRHATKLDVFEDVFQIFAGFDVFEFDFDPV